MEIRIDTTKDSKEDIRKAIKLLRSLISEEGYEEETLQQQSYDAAPGTFNLFDDDDEPQNKEEDTGGEEEKKPPKVEIIEY